MATKEAARRQLWEAVDDLLPRTSNRPDCRAWVFEQILSDSNDVGEEKLLHRQFRVICACGRYPL